MQIDQHDMKKDYDKQLLKRLMAYAKPYKWSIIFSLILLIAVIGVELARPVIIGIAVDDIISDTNRFYILSDSGEGDIAFGGYDLTQTDVYDDENELYGRLFYYEEGEKGLYGLVSGINVEDASKYYEADAIDIPSLAATDGYVIEVLDEGDIKKVREKDIAGLIKLMVVYIVLLLIGLTINYFQTLLLHYSGQKIIYNIREEVFSHLHQLSVEFFNQNPVGKLVTRVTNDTETLNEMYTSVIVNSVKNALTLIGISIMMFVLNWQLTLIVFAVLPLIGLATWLFRKYSRDAYRDVRTRVAAINAFLSEHISGMKLVQIFSQEERKMEKFIETNKKLKDANMLQILIYSIFRPSMYFIYVLALALVVGFGGWFVMEEILTIGVLIIFLQYISNFFSPIQQLAEQFNILQSAMASAEKIFSLLDENQSIDPKTDGIIIKDLKGEIEFKNVWFAYTSEEWVLKDVSFKVNPGETFAFVGATGAGKTSILNLINRYYEIQKGDIFIDGYNIKDLNLKSLRKQIGQMMQDVFVFTGTIESNIGLSAPDMTIERIKDASEYVHASHFISQLKEGYKEHVYERGATLSTGQRQLLSFARTLAHKPAVLILDEATSNIDTETENLIQDALVKIMEGRTTLVVAHRLSTIQHADQIVVLHKGQIKEQGNHQSLLAKEGYYYRLYQLQYQDESYLI